MPGRLFGAEPSSRHRLSRHSSVVVSGPPNARIARLLVIPRSTAPDTRSLGSCERALMPGSFAQAQSPFLYVGEANFSRGLESWCSASIDSSRARAPLGAVVASVTCVRCTLFSPKRRQCTVAIRHRTRRCRSLPSGRWPSGPSQAYNGLRRCAGVYGQPSERRRCSQDRRCRPKHQWQPGESPGILCTMVGNIWAKVKAPSPPAHRPAGPFFLPQSPTSFASPCVGWPSPASIARELRERRSLHSASERLSGRVALSGKKYVQICIAIGFPVLYIERRRIFSRGIKLWRITLWWKLWAAQRIVRRGRAWACSC